MHIVYSDVDFMDTTAWIPSPFYTSTHLHNLHNNSIALRYGAISTVLKTSRTLLEKDIKTNPVIIDELSGPVYILTGILPIEAQIHIKALTFFNNVCHQGGKNTEKMLARRQLTVKEESSNNWFICVNKILRKYDLKEAYNYLDNPIKKSRWFSLVKSKVNDHWCTQLTTLHNSTKGCNILVTTT